VAPAPALLVLPLLPVAGAGVCAASGGRWADTQASMASRATEAKPAGANDETNRHHKPYFQELGHPHSQHQCSQPSLSIHKNLNHTAHKNLNHTAQIHTNKQLLLTHLLPRLPFSAATSLLGAASLSSTAARWAGANSWASVGEEVLPRCHISRSSTACRWGCGAAQVRYRNDRSSAAWSHCSDLEALPKGETKGRSTRRSTRGQGKAAAARTTQRREQ